MRGICVASLFLSVFSYERGRSQRVQISNIPKKTSHPQAGSRGVLSRSGAGDELQIINTSYSGYLCPIYGTATIDPDVPATEAAAGQTVTWGYRVLTEDMCGLLPREYQHSGEIFVATSRAASSGSCDVEVIVQGQDGRTGKEVVSFPVTYSGAPESMYASILKPTFGEIPAAVETTTEASTETTTTTVLPTNPPIAGTDSASLNSVATDATVAPPGVSQATCPCSAFPMLSALGLGSLVALVASK